MATTTRKDLRRMVGRHFPLEQYRLLAATANGTTTSFIDTERLQGPDNAYRGALLYFAGGANLGTYRHVQSSSQSAAQLTWGTPATSTVAGDEAELWNLRGEGVDPVQVNEAINDAIANLAKNAWIPVNGNVAAAFDQTVATVAVPAALTRGMYGVDYQDRVDTARWIEVDGGGEDPTVGWWYDRANAVVAVGGWWRTFLDAATLRIRGYGGTAALAADTDATPIDAEAIVTEVVRLLVMTNAVKNPDLDRYLQATGGEGAAKRSFATGRPSPNTIVF